MVPIAGAKPTDPEPLSALPLYSQRHQDEAEARAYDKKFERGLLRRLGGRREQSLVRRAVRQAWFERFGVWPEAGAPSPAPSLLDLPCGAGRFAPLLCSFKVRYHAGDFSRSMLLLCGEALRRSGQIDRLAGLVHCDARNIPLPEQSLDLACCLRLLHHFPLAADRAACLRSFRRILRGPLVIGFLDANAPKQRLHRVKRSLLGVPVRRSLLSRKELQEEAKAAGFHLQRTWSLSGWFSGQSLALLLPR